jgi:hypothetical protein
MKRTFFLVLFLTLCSSAFAQGLVHFQNTPATLVSFNYGGDIRPISGAPGPYYFALLIAPMGGSNVTDFVFCGLYATNISAEGRFGGPSEAQVPGILPGQMFGFEIAGWTSEAGPTFQKDWLDVPPCGGMGFSTVGSGIAGGSSTNGILPALDLFGGETGIQVGFTISAVLDGYAPTASPVLFAPTLTPALDFSFSAQVQANRFYALQYSTNLADWITVSRFQSCPPVFDYTDTNKAAARFFRIISGYAGPAWP